MRYLVDEMVTDDIDVDKKFFQKYLKIEKKYENL